MGLTTSVYPVDIERKLPTVALPITPNTALLKESIPVTRELLNGSSGLFRVYFSLQTATPRDYELAVSTSRQGGEFGFGAKADAVIENGGVSNIIMSATGDGYPIGVSATVPGTNITFDNTGTGATVTAEAIAVINGGELVSINVTNPGAGYNIPPKVLITSTPFDTQDTFLNADNEFLLRSAGYYRFDIGVRAGDLINFFFEEHITADNLVAIDVFRVDQIQIGA